MKHKLASVVCAVTLASAASAQLSSYLGPGILTGGADTIGTRAGEQVDLRFYASLTGIYDNGIQPVSVDSKGNLIQVGGLYGVELGLGAYGVHSWRVSQLGLDYKGDLRHYDENSYYDGSDHTLTIGFTYQQSRRLFYNLQGVGGTYSNYLGAVAGSTAADTAALIINQPNLLLFDNRTYFGQGDASVTYLLSPRASVTVGGEGFIVDRQSSALVGMNGYGGNANFRYRVNRVTSVGAQYSRQHYQYPDTFGQSDLNMYSLLFATQMGRFWTFSADGGVYQTDVTGLQAVTLDPAIAALLGTSTTLRVFAANNWVPSAHATLNRKFKNANLSITYARTVMPGNGVYLTSRTQSGMVGYDYTGIRKFSLSIIGGYSSLNTLGQGLAPYSMFTGGAGLTYNLTHALHAVARYDARQQEIELAGYRRTSYRVTLGIAFSPGSVPLSLW